MKIFALCFLFLIATSYGALITYSTTLSGANVQPNATNSAGTGSVTLLLDDVSRTLNVTASFTGLTGTSTAAHIHCCTATANSGTAGVAILFTGFPNGVTSGSYSASFNLLDSAVYNSGFFSANNSTVLNAYIALIAGFNARTSYFNLHTTSFQGGEISGFFALGVATSTPLTTTTPTQAVTQKPNSSQMIVLSNILLLIISFFLF